MTASRSEAFGSSLAMLAVLLCAPAAAAETMDDLYAEAKAEKSLVFYSGGPVAPYEASPRSSSSASPA